MGWAYQAGASGTVTLPVGAVVLAIVASSVNAAGTVAIFGGTAIPVVGAAGIHTPWRREFPHRDAVAVTGALDIVFTNTESYFVEYLAPPT